MLILNFQVLSAGFCVLLSCCTEFFQRPVHFCYSSAFCFCCIPIYSCGKAIIDFCLLYAIYISDNFRTKMCFFSLFLKAEDIWISGDIKRKNKIKSVCLIYCIHTCWLLASFYCFNTIISSQVLQIWLTAAPIVLTESCVGLVWWCFPCNSFYCTLLNDCML